MINMKGGNCKTITMDSAMRLALGARIIAMEEVLVAKGLTTRDELKQRAEAQVEQLALDETDKEDIKRFLLK